MGAPPNGFAQRWKLLPQGKGVPRPYAIPGGADAKDKGVIPTAPRFLDQGAIKVAIRSFVFISHETRRERESNIKGRRSEGVGCKRGEIDIETHRRESKRKKEKKESKKEV